MIGVPILLRNANADHHHRVELKLVGAAGSPRDAVGATVYLNAAGMRQRGDVLSGGSYLSSNDLRIHFGLATPAMPVPSKFTDPRAQKKT
jgi:enediyne biosynthesis protein E4